VRRLLTCGAIFVIFCAGVFGLASMIALEPGIGPAGLAARWPGKRFGVTWEVAGPVSPDDIAWLASTGANGIVQMPFPRQEHVAKPEIDEPDYRVWGQREKGIRITTRLAREQGISTVLKPHLYVVDRDSGFWPGDIRMVSEEDWQRWFARYSELILDYADLAREEGIEALCVGAELRQTLRHERQWRALIEQVRQRYPGCVMYSVNWDDYHEFQFADAVDAIGVQAYFPLSEELRPTRVEIERGWEAALAEFEPWALRQGKPIVFTEVGFHSCVGALTRPWEWKFDGMPVDFDLQADAYDVTLSILRRRPWLHGIYFWKWIPGHPSPARADDTEFHPQGKPAEDVLRRHFFEERQR